MYKTPMFPTKAEAVAYTRRAILATAMNEEESDIDRYDVEGITAEAFGWSAVTGQYIWVTSSDRFQQIKWDHYIEGRES